MAATCADTSFLFSLFGRDARTPNAQTWVRQAQQTISVTLLNRYEFRNAVRFAAFRKLISRADAQASITAFDSDLNSGYLQLVAYDLPAIFTEADRLSNLHTVRQGPRSFDLLHVAGARLLNATTFLTFDLNQKKLAVAAGLTVWP